MHVKITSSNWIDMAAEDRETAVYPPSRPFPQQAQTPFRTFPVYTPLFCEMSCDTHAIGVHACMYTKRVASHGLKVFHAYVVSAGLQVGAQSALLEMMRMGKPLSASTTPCSSTTRLWVSPQVLPVFLPTAKFVAHFVGAAQLCLAHIAYSHVTASLCSGLMIRSCTEWAERAVQWGLGQHKPSAFF